MNQLAERVRECFEYDSGKLLWKSPPKTHPRLLGKEAGGINEKGYVSIQLDGKRYRRSQLVFLYHYGKIPRPVTDHINRVRHDDRIENLRELSVADNNRNNSKRNITLRKTGRYQVRRGQRHLGMFDTLKEAEGAYDKNRYAI